MAKKRRKRRSRSRDAVITPTVTFTKVAVGIPVVYGSLGAAARIPGTGPAISGVLPSMDTGFNLMSLTGVTQAGGGLVGSIKELKRVTKKRKRR